MSEEEVGILEVATVLAMGDRTHSQVAEQIPARGVVSTGQRDVEPLLRKVLI